MMLPHLEPYLIRSINQSLEHIKDERLREEARRFCAQEGHHFRQHAKANRVIKALNPKFEKLAEIEAELAAEYQNFSKNKSLLFNLAYADGFESMTAAMSCAQVETGFYEELDNPLGKLALWHVIEELEHRTVAYDVFKAVGGRYLYRVIVGTWAQRHYMNYCKRLAQVMIDAEPEMIEKFDTPEAKANVKMRMKKLMKKAMPRVLSIYMPWYSPRKLKLPERFESLRQGFSKQALRVE